MEKEKASKVGCQACKNSRKIKNFNTGVFIAGGILFTLSIYGLVSLILDIVSLF